MRQNISSIWPAGCQMYSSDVSCVHVGLFWRWEVAPWWPKIHSSSFEKKHFSHFYSSVIGHLWVFIAGEHVGLVHKQICRGDRGMDLSQTSGRVKSFVGIYLLFFWRVYEFSGPSLCLSQIFAASPGSYKSAEQQPLHRAKMKSWKIIEGKGCFPSSWHFLLCSVFLCPLHC